MKELRIKFDFSHGPIWKDKFDVRTGKWSTGIDVIDNDKALAILNEEAEKEYAALYSFDENGLPHFNNKAYEANKHELLSLVQTIVLRVNSLNDGTYKVIDEETEQLSMH